MSKSKYNNKQDEGYKKNKQIQNRSRSGINGNNITDLDRIFNKIESNGSINKEKILNKIDIEFKNQTKEIDSINDEKMTNVRDYICDRLNENKDITITEILNNKTEIIQNIEKTINSEANLTKINKQLENLEYNIENKFINMESHIKGMNSVIEILEGKLKQLDYLSDIKELLMNLSNNQNKIDKKPTNYEEEVVMNLGEYGSKIISELTNISSEYARNKEKIENISKVEEEHAIKLNESKKQYEQKGKISLVEEICEKFIDLDELFEEKNNESTIIVGILKNNEFLKSEGLEKGTEIEINEENRAKMETKVSFSELGKYKITKSAFELNGVIKYKAEVEKIQ